jgi:hypothetical protein
MWGLLCALGVLLFVVAPVCIAKHRECSKVHTPYSCHHHLSGAVPHLQSELLAELAEATTVGSGMSVMQERVQQAHKELQAVSLVLL